MKTSARIAFRLCVLFFISSSLLSFVPTPGTGKVSVKLQHLVGEHVLKLDTVLYKNGFGQDFTVTKFRYYIGNIVLKKKDGTEFRSESYYLVDEENDASKQLVIENVPLDNYSALEFIIGVDSLHNCSGAQSGALDPVNAMFWAWNSGYIFLKLEGVAAASGSPGHLFEYHIGGYRQPHNCIRKIHIELEAGAQKNLSEVFLQVDIMKILNAGSRIDFSVLSSVTDFRHATEVADNYQRMFSLVKTNYEN